MDRLLIPAAVALLTLATHTPAAAWGTQGHQAVAAVAQANLTPATKNAIAPILHDTSDLSPGALAALATWPDEIRARAAFGSVPTAWSAADVAEADQFNRDHKTNGNWHFVNLPLGAPDYPPTDPPAGDPMRAFLGPDDIVHAIRQCIAILEAPVPPADFSKLQALRWLVHLVGDLHQPLHVTTGYYDTASPSFATAPVRIDDPSSAAAGGVLGDRGGNELLFSKSSDDNLHALWDTCLPALVSGAICNSTPAPPYASLASVLAQRQLDPAITAPPGNYHDWPVIWVSDSLRQAVASDAYAVTLTTGRVLMNTHTSEESAQATIGSPLKSAYTLDHLAIVSDQLNKAAARLAALLNAIAWK